MNPVLLSHEIWSFHCSQRIWDLVSSGRSADIVLLTEQKVTRIKVSLER